MSATIEQTIGELKATLIAYIEATYHIGDPAMVRQRQRLLEQVGGIFQRPYLESTPRYMAGRSYGEMTELPPSVREAFVALSNPEAGRRSSSIPRIGTRNRPSMTFWSGPRT